ncbi:MAG: DMT family transporter [Candidatus Pacearchaeota archaeon]
MNNQTKGILFALLTVLLWATTGTAMKLAVSRIDAFVVTVYIGLMATIALGIYLAFTKKISEVYAEFKRQKSLYIIAGIIGLGFQQIAYLKSYALLPASQVVILFYLYPLFMVAIAALFFKEKTSRLSWLFLLMGFAGVYILVAKGQLVVPELNLGTILVILAALGWALFSVLIKHYQFDIEVGMFIFNLVGLLSLAALIPFFGFAYKLSIAEFLGIAYIGVILTAGGFLLWNRALRLTRTAICSNIALLVPVFSLICIALVLKEQIAWPQIIGLVLILSSVVLSINLGRK